MYIVRVQDTFCAAHTVRLAGVEERVHGHNWRVELAVACAELDTDGVTIDFVALRDALHSVLDNALDHRNLTTVEGFESSSASSENVCEWIALRISPFITELREDAQIESVTVWETPECGITYYPSIKKI
jgi:6-pyruvoyltetrahydropterin/6-carboxytetrahydropterin synthase